MTLFFDPYPPFLRWYKEENGNYEEGKCAFAPGWFDKVIKEVGGIKENESVGYCLYHGGEIIKSPVTRLNPAVVKRLEQCIKFSPECNALTFRVVRRCIKEFPGAKHTLLCDTAFFTNLPQEASTYSVPYELLKKGIRRYGGYGLCHQWAWEKNKIFSYTPMNKAISVYLGNHTNAVAIEKGISKETSSGFANLEGIISSRSCGDIDPSVIFQLHSTGMSFTAISRLLSNESGFTALIGKKTEFLDILKRGKGAKEVALREIYYYNILKYVGAFISVLDGTDAIIFTSEEIKKAIPLILEICKRFEFLGFKLKPKNSIDGNKIIFDLATKDSSIKVFCLEYNKRKVLTDWIKEDL
jgi:acetate kinase